MAEPGLSSAACVTPPDIIPGGGVRRQSFAPTAAWEDKPCGVPSELAREMVSDAQTLIPRWCVKGLPGWGLLPVRKDCLLAAGLSMASEEGGSEVANRENRDMPHLGLPALW